MWQPKIPCLSFADVTFFIYEWSCNPQVLCNNLPCSLQGISLFQKQFHSCKDGNRTLLPSEKYTSTLQSDHYYDLNLFYCWNLIYHCLNTSPSTFYTADSLYYQQCQHEESQNCTCISDSCKMLYLLSAKPVLFTYLWYKIIANCS
jgi:hypothetical protein